jgi:hypothetical protein
MSNPCQHCHRLKAVCGRGLCRPCRSDPAVYDRYEDRTYREPTMAELDALIAEQLPTMPAGNEGEEPTPRYREPRCLVRTRQARVMRKKI